MQRANLFRQLLAKPDNVLRHRVHFQLQQILFLAGDQAIDSIQRHSAVIADNPSASVRVGQARNNASPPRRAHLGRIGIEDALVVGFANFGEQLHDLARQLEAVRFASIHDHLDSAERLNRPFQRSVGLQADDLLFVLIDISRSMGSDRRYRPKIDIQNAPVVPLHLRQHLDLLPQRRSRRRRSGQKPFVSRIRGNIAIQEIFDVDALLPTSGSESSPRFIAAAVLPKLRFFYCHDSGTSTNRFDS